MRQAVSLLFFAACFLCATTASVSAQLDTEGLLAKMIAASGGSDRLSEVSTSITEGQIVFVSQGGATGSVKITNAYPDKTLIEIDIAGFKILQGFDGNVAWIDNPMADGYQELPADDRAGMKRGSIGFDAYLHPERHGIEFSYKGEESIDGAGYHLIEQRFDDGHVEISYVNSESYLVYKTVVNEGSPEQPSISETYYTDYRDTDGIVQTHQVSVYNNGQESMRYLYDALTYNQEINNSIFLRTDERFTQEELIADARQLTEIIEATHPDPYKLMGGKIAYHRQFQHLLHALPEDGMTKNDFREHARNFVAAIRDAHTEVYAHRNVDVDAPGGIPLRFKVIGHSLVVQAIPHERYKNLLGAVLLAVENVTVDELANRLRTLRPIENEYYLLWHFTANYLWYEPYLQELLPEWENPDQLRVRLLKPTGDTIETVFDVPMNVASLTSQPSRISLPSTDESGMATGFLGQEGKVAYFCIDRMDYYRESYEVRNHLGIESRTEEELSKIPSVTERLTSFVKEMKAAGAESLIVDLRRNGGGDALMCDFIMYFLYGRRAMFETRGSTIMKISDMYLRKRENVSLDDINQNRAVALVNGDYDFSADYTDEILRKDSAIQAGFAFDTPTFFREWESGAHERYYCPPKVIVLTTTQTFSAGFYVAMRLRRAGAVLVGTPSSQTPNSAASSINWSLNNTGITGRVSKAYALNYPEDSELSRLLEVHYPLTLELLKHYDFDPNAEVLYAIDLLPEIAEQERR